jgi:hypothetical protein
LSPIVTGGLPAPGFEEVELLLEDELELFELLEDPQAASPAANAATASPVVNFRIIVSPWSWFGIRLVRRFRRSA